MRVHIVIQPGVDSEDALKAIVDASNIQNINEPRFKKFRLLTGDIDPDKFDVIKGLDCVQSISEDEKRSIQ